MENWEMDLLIGLVGAVIGSIGTYFTLRFNYKQLYAQTVSSNRMEWINVWRESVSSFLACAEVLQKHHCNNKDNGSSDDSEKEKECLVKYEHEMYKSRAMILSRLNLTEPEHVEMMAALEKFNFNCDNKQFALQRELILELARIILKPEWERMKREAKGERK